MAMKAPSKSYEKKEFKKGFSFRDEGKWRKAFEALLMEILQGARFLGRSHSSRATLMFLQGPSSPFPKPLKWEVERLVLIIYLKGRL